MLVTIGEAGDPENDPTLAGRRTERVKGRHPDDLVRDDQRAPAGENINFDPLSWATDRADRRPRPVVPIAFVRPSFIKRLQGL